MLIYKTSCIGCSPNVIIPIPEAVDNLSVDIFIDTQAAEAKLFYTFDSLQEIILNKRKTSWLLHDIGVLPDFFADRLWGGVTALKVIQKGQKPVDIKIQFTN